MNPKPLADIEAKAEQIAVEHTDEDAVTIEIDVRDKYLDDFDTLVKQYEVPKDVAIRSLGLRAANDHSKAEINPEETINIDV